MTEEFMRVEDAIEIVLDLARQNVIEDCDDEDMEAEQRRQETAIGVIDDFATNVIAEGRVWTAEEIQPLAEEWLDMRWAAETTEDPDTSIAVNEVIERMEAEGKIPADVLLGLEIGLKWALDNFYSEDREIGGWNVSDVISCGQEDCGVDLTMDQARTILEIVWREMDASVGINWTTIEFAINDWLSQHPGEAAPYTEDTDA